MGGRLSRLTSISPSLQATRRRSTLPISACAGLRGWAYRRYRGLNLDRLTCQPQELEDWIDRAESCGLLLVTANGDADLATDGGRMYARVKASVARGEVERESARQSHAQLQRAQQGRPPRGSRLRVPHQRGCDPR